MDTDNNHFPREIKEERFLVKPKKEDKKNPIQKAAEREIDEEAEEEESPSS